MNRILRKKSAAIQVPFYDYNRQQRLDIFDSILPYYFLRKFLGMAPYNIVGVSGNRRFEPNRLQYFISFIITGIIIAMFSFGFTQRSDYVAMYYTYVTAFIELFQVSCTILMAIIHYLSSVYYQKRYMNIFRKFNNVDDFIPSLGKTVNYRKIRFSVSKVVVCWTAVNVLKTYLDYTILFRGNYMLYWLIYWMPYFLSSATDISAIVNLINLQYRYEILNDCLTETIIGPKLVRKDKLIEIPTTSDRQKYLLDTLRRTKYIHWHLTDIGCDIADIYSLSMLATSANVFFAWVSGLIDLSVQLKHFETVETLIKNLGGIGFYSISATINLMIIIYNYRKTKTQVN